MHSNCLICSSTSLHLLKDYEKAHLCKCGNCGFVFAQKIPTTEELEEHYKGYGRNDYLSPITIKRYHELLDQMESFRKTNKLLDVGCGIGYFLEVAKERGWEVYGTEYTDEAVSICTDKGINMHKGQLDPKNYDAESFDVITSFEVIEHINNPLEELGNFNMLLRKGGLVYVTTPNFNSLLRYRLKAAYNVIVYPEHLSYYTPKTLKKVFTVSGFSCRKIETTGISLTRLKTSQGKSDQAYISASSDDEQLRNSMETKWYLKLAKKVINGTLTLIGKGDSLKGWFMKD
ncbi:MAG: class I SAM-dependent methyltransferase [Bacteroidetes bacterium]|nr:MAG: class I SAM-dependent methyltransferase [Bacteroidota bacterium]